MSKLIQQAAMLLCLLTFSCLNAQNQVLRLRPLVSSDDAEQNIATGSVNLSSSDLELGGYDWDQRIRQVVGIRFPNVVLPQGATISKVYIQFSTNQAHKKGATVNIKAQRGNALTYTTANNDIYSRVYTNSTINWDIPAWTILNQRSSLQQTPNLKSLISEAIQGGWVSGDALAFSFYTSGNDYANAYSFDGGSNNNIPELVIEYTSISPLSVSANKSSGTYYSPFTVALSSTSGATIRYTVDGSNPTATTGIEYTAPIAINSTTNIKAIAILNGTISEVLTLNYTIAPLSISADKPSGTYTNSVSVALAGTTGATIRYTTDGSNPTATTGLVYTAPISLSSTTTIKAISVLNGSTSNVLTLNYTIEINNNVKTAKYKITNTNDDAEERLSDGTVSLNSSDLELGGYDYPSNYSQIVGVRFSNIVLPTDAKITRAYIQFSAKEVSLTPLATIEIKIQNTTTATIFGASNKNISSRSFLNNKIDWATQKWSANERTSLQQTPDLNTLIQEAITVGGWRDNMSLAFSFSTTTAGWANALSFDGSAAGAPELVVEYTSNTPALSINADKASGTYYEPFTVSLTGTAGATIRYTTDGTTPTTTTGLVYSNPISVNATTVIKAISVLNNTASSVLTLNYTIAPLSISADKTSGTYYAPFNVNLTGTAGTTIRYTTDGTTPTATTGVIYTAPIAVNATTTIKAISVLNNTVSNVLTLNYTIGTLTVSADKANGTYYTPISVALTGTAGATIRYTTDGTAPTATRGTIYSAPISVNATTTIKAISIIGNATSSVLTLNYTIIPLTITASQSTGVYKEAFQLTLTGTAGATIRYTTDGSLPTATTGSVYSAPISINNSVTIRAISVINNATSNILTQTYILETGVGIKTVRYRITNTNDDAEERTSDGAMFLTSSDLELGGYDYGSKYAQIVGIRFPNIVLPVNAQITKAYFQFSVKEVSLTPLASVDIKIQNTTNADAFTTTSKNISSRSFSSNKVVWSTSKWQLVNDRTLAQQSSDISSLIQEAISNGWSANMALGFSLSASTAGWANAFSYDGGATSAPELVIEYREVPIERTLLSNVYINEVAGSGSMDNKMDWIEIFNNNSKAISLDSVGITDDKKVPFKFMFAANRTMPQKGFTVVNADDTLSVSTPTAAAFGISAKGETIYLFQKYNGVLHLLDSMIVGATEFNTSFGRSPDASTNVIKFATPTPSVSNNNSKKLEELSFSHPRGFYTNSFDLTITAPAGMTIKYTTNRTAPSATNGSTYTAPVTINSSTVLRIYAYDNTRETKIITLTYVFANAVAQQLSLPSSDVEQALKELPIVSLSMTGSTSSQTTIPCTFEYINKHGENLSVSADAGYNIFGLGSLTEPKKNMRVFFKSEYGTNKLKYKIFDRMPGETYNPTDEFDALDFKGGQDAMYSTNLADYVAHGLLRKMGSKDIHVRFVNVFVNGTYWGVCPLREKFDNNYAASYFTGNDEEFDYLKTSNSNINWPTTSQFFADPGNGTMTHFNDVVATAASKNYQELKKKVDVLHLTNTLLTFLAGDAQAECKAIIGKNFATPMVFLLKDVDTYMDDTRPPHSQTQDVNLTNNTKGPLDLFALTGMGGGTSVLEYKTLAKDRLQLTYLETNGVMVTDTIRAIYRQAQAIVKNSMALDFARWKQLSMSTWNSRIDLITNNIPNRLTKVINKFKQYNLAHTLKAVSFSEPAGNISIGQKVYITNPNANTQVYYTLDGSDVVFDNGISATAHLYDATKGIELPLGKTKIRARAYTTGNFGMYADIEYIVSRPVKITAIAYQPNPAAPAADVKTNDVYEFFTLTNTGTASIDISNFMVTEAIDTFRFPQGTSIASGETVMMCSDDTKYPLVSLRKFKWVKGKLANEGENISFRDNLGNLINEVRYDTLTPWPYAKGNGSYIRLKSNTLDNSKGENWEVSSLNDYLSPANNNLQNAFRFVVTGRLQSNEAHIQWISNTGTKVDYFNVEKLNEQGIYELKEVIQSNANGLQTYNYSDKNLKEGDNVYRVVLFQNNNTPRYSDPIKVEFKTLGVYTVYPNPASEDAINIDLKNVQFKETDIELYNTVGQLIKKATVKDMAVYQMSIQGVKTGQYMLVIKPKGQKPVTQTLIISQ